jgi:prevent-host-death family protein
MKHEIISVSTAKTKFLELVRKVNEEDLTYVITQDGESIGALIPMESYESMLETSDILSDQETLANIETALEEVKTHKLWKRDKNGRWIA